MAIGFYSSSSKIIVKTHRQKGKENENEVAIKCKLEVDAVAAMLSDLANSFKEGKVVIQKGSSFVTLRPAGAIEGVQSNLVAFVSKA